MSMLLEVLGRGLLGELLSAFESQLPDGDEDLIALRTRRGDSPKSRDLAMRHGMASLAQMQWAEARQAFSDALGMGGSPTQPALGLACVHDELGQSEQTLRYLFLAHAHDPTDPAIVFAIALCKERSGDTDAAADYYQRALAICPRLRNAFERLAAIAIRKRDLPDALRCYESLAKIEPDDVEILTLLATLCMAAGRPLDAAVQFERALLIEPECTEPALSDTHSLESDGLIEAAAEKMSALVRKYPGIPDFHVHLGDLLVKLGRDEAAIEQYKSALELHPGYLEATVKLGTQHLRAARFADAAQFFNRAVELNDRLITAYVGLGVAQNAGGHTQEAHATFDLASSLEPNSTLLFAEAARLHLKSEYGQSRRDGGASSAGHGGLRGDDTAPSHHDASATDGYGDSSRSERDTPCAADLLGEQIRRHRQALLLRPNHADLHYRYGLLLRQVGEFDAAIAAFRNALSINPAYVKAIVKLGICLKEMGRADEAIETFSRALELRGDFVDVHYELGLLFAQRNRFDLAVDAFEHAAAGQSPGICFRANLALALQNIGMLDRAAATWRSICELACEADETLETRRSLMPDDSGV